MLHSFDIEARGGLIYKYDQGVFYVQLILFQDEVEPLFAAIDCRASDAIKLCLRQKVGLWITHAAAEAAPALGLDGL